MWFITHFSHSLHFLNLYAVRCMFYILLVFIPLRNRTMALQDILELKDIVALPDPLNSINTYWMNEQVNNNKNKIERGPLKENTGVQKGLFMFHQISATCKNSNFIHVASPGGKIIPVFTPNSMTSDQHTVTVIWVHQALPGAIQEEDATRLDLRDWRPGELSQHFFGQDNFSESPGLLNQTLPEFQAKWSNTLAWRGINHPKHRVVASNLGCLLPLETCLECAIFSSFTPRIVQVWATALFFMRKKNYKVSYLTLSPEWSYPEGICCIRFFFHLEFKHNVMNWHTSLFLPPLGTLAFFLCLEPVAVDHSPWAPLPSGFQVGSWRYEWEVLEGGRELKECEVNVFLHPSVICTWLWNGCIPPQPQPPLGIPSLMTPAPTGPKGWQRPPPWG